MQGVTLNPVLLPLSRSVTGSGRAARDQAGEGNAAGQPKRRFDYQFDSATQAQLKESLLRYMRYGEEQQAGGRRSELPLRNQRALDAYVGTRRDEEKAYLHETLGIDGYA